jgi:hypothetical protein
MPKINGIAVATVRDLREFLSLVEALHGPEVIPYFWDDLDDKQFIPLRQITESSIERKMPPDHLFVALETYDPDPDGERRGPLSEFIDS